MAVKNCRSEGSQSVLDAKTPYRCQKYDTLVTQLYCMSEIEAFGMIQGASDSRGALGRQMSLLWLRLV